MISMSTKQEIILNYFREGVSIRRISKELGIHRKTVRKYVSEYSSSLENLGYKGFSNEIVAPPSYNTSSRTRKKLTPEILDEIKRLLSINEKRRSNGQHKQQYKSIDIHEHLHSKGIKLGYSTVCRCVKELEDRTKEAFIRQEYKRGDVCEFDWGMVRINTSNGIETYQLAVFTTGYSNYRYARLYKHQDTNSFQQSHVHFFEKVGGVFKTLVYDNMKVAVKNFVGRTEREATDGLLKLAMYYNFSFRFCNPRKGNEKGKVERSVEYLRRKTFAHKDTFESLEEANKYLETRCDELNRRVKEALDNRSSTDLLSDEKSHLFPIKPSFDCSSAISMRVDKYSTITYNTSHYSVPDNLVGKMVMARIYPDKIKVSYDDKSLCTHSRLSGRFEWSIKLKHYIKTLKRKPRALVGSTALDQADTLFKEIYTSYFTKREKEFIELIDYCRSVNISATKLRSIIKYIRPLRETDLTLDKIKILWERGEEEVKPIDSNSEISKACSRQLKLASSMMSGSSKVGGIDE